jgi:hypothetical protein
MSIGPFPVFERLPVPVPTGTIYAACTGGTDAHECRFLFMEYVVGLVLEYEIPLTCFCEATGHANIGR